MNARNSKTHFVKTLLIAVVLYLCSCPAFAQPVLPNHSVTAIATQGIHFGTLYTTSAGGTVTVGYDGIRSSTGGVTLLAIAPTSQPAIFEIKLCQGRNINITFDATTILTGSNGGELTLDLGPTEKGISGASFATNADCNFITPLRMGGTLHVPGTAIPGAYNGSFAITFNQE
jgi:hypothetical protein